MYEARKIIVVDSCNTCPFNGECKPWKALTRKQRITLAIGNSSPRKFILNGCPLPDGEDGSEPFEGLSQENK